MIEFLPLKNEGKSEFNREVSLAILQALQGLGEEA
jgi:hypothetical protein